MRYLVAAALVIACVGQASAQHAPEAVADLFQEHCLSQKASAYEAGNVARAKKLYLLRGDELGTLPIAPELAGNSYISGFRTIAKGGGEVVLGIVSFPYTSTAPTAACALGWRAADTASPLTALRGLLGSEGATSDAGVTWTLSGGWKRVEFRQDVKPAGVTYTLVALNK